MAAEINIGELDHRLTRAANGRPEALWRHVYQKTFSEWMSSEFLLDCFEYAEARPERQDLAPFRDLRRFFLTLQSKYGFVWATTEEYEKMVEEGEYEAAIQQGDLYHGEIANDLIGEDYNVERYFLDLDDIVAFSYLVRFPENVSNIPLKPARRS